MKAAAMRPAGFDDWTPEEQMDWEEANYDQPWCIATDVGPFGCPIYSLHNSWLGASFALSRIAHPGVRAMETRRALAANRREYEAFTGRFS